MADKPIAAICHGAQLLAAAGVAPAMARGQAVAATAGTREAFAFDDDHVPMNAATSIRSACCSTSS